MGTACQAVGGAAVNNRAAFHIVHAMMAFAAAGRVTSAARLFAAVKGRVTEGSSQRIPENALAYPFCEALLEFARGDYPACVSWLERVRDIARHCGGSLAQCDLIHLTFTEAALRARNTTLAFSLVKERTAQKPSSRLNRLLARRLWSMEQAAA